ncbi:MAG TPA: hypothetical protein VFY73_07665 [Ideonella sp.]|uniref:hypothetical protein n=1 Tax=Ideonella sp. TaxID=1929293 RepID=UPI002E34D258|nr:hypothetical protein [Ideonella sp.]HEX5683897.1 hypothetical protein [Ideonella sp.]
MPIDKVVLALHAALQAKYGDAGLARIGKALRALVAADKRRGLATVVIHLDDEAEMAPYGGPTPAVADARAVKNAIDRIAATALPHYMMLLGGPDVMPMVPITNPAYSGPEGDSDRHVPSDLPYACEAPYSTNPNRFLGPTRVVGRLPDLIGASKPTLLTQLINAAARSKPRPRSDFQSSFGLSAEAWAKSTALSLTNTFGHADGLLISPPKGPRWSANQLAPRVHFINCHGGDSVPEYYGQPPDKDEFPLAHHAKHLRGKVSAGTVVAAECCYGAQLYDPADAAGQKGIALTYLEDGAAAVFGSTTIAYGPCEGNGSADLICQYFIQQILGGSSLGRAALEARQKFAGARTHLDPYDLKTLMQFYLLGDPSAQPVAATAHSLTRGKAFRKAFANMQDRTVRNLRRERLEREGNYLGQALPALRPIDQAPGDKVATALKAMTRESGLQGKLTHLSFEIAPPKRGNKTGPQRRVHIVKGRRPVHEAGTSALRVVALVATEEDGQLIHVRRLHSR